MRVAMDGGDYRVVSIGMSMSISIRVAVGVAMDGGDYRGVSIGMSMVSIAISHMAIVSISFRLSCSSGLSISRPLAIVVSMSISIRVAVGEAMDGGDYRVVSIDMSITISKMAIVSISFRLSCSSGLSINRPLAIVVSMSISMAIVAMRVSMVGNTMVTISQMVAIAIVGIASISISISLSPNSCKETQSSNSHGFHHCVCLQARGFSSTPH